MNAMGGAVSKNVGIAGSLEEALERGTMICGASAVNAVPAPSPRSSQARLGKSS